MNDLILLFLTTTAQLNLPVGLLDAVCYVESNHNVSALNSHDGGSSSLGVCQMKLNTARSLGFKGTSKQLLTPKVNVYYAGLYLNKNLHRYQWDVGKAVAAYNAGRCRLNARGLIKNRKYVDKVFKAWKKGVLANAGT